MGAFLNAPTERLLMYKISDMNFVIIGYGSIAQSMLVMLVEHAKINPDKITIISMENKNPALLESLGIKNFLMQTITPNNHQSIIGAHLTTTTVLLNLAVQVSSADLIVLAQEKKAFYLDTGIEPWQYQSENSTHATTNMALRQQVMALKQAGQRTAIVAHGANPGFVSILIKQALLKMAADHLEHWQTPATRDDWIALAETLSVRVIQIAERDTQVRAQPRQAHEFINTWSVSGLISEGLQQAELGWGSHEQTLPQHCTGYPADHAATITLNTQGINTRVKTWTPNGLHLEALLITHNEAISIADYFTRYDNHQIIYRPTCYYAYHPSDATVESIAFLRQFGSRHFDKHTIIQDDIISGNDELGVLVFSDKYRPLWLGSCLSAEKARKQVRGSNATSLQVVSSIYAAILWMLQYPDAGIVESDQLDHAFIWNITHEFWNPMLSQYLTQGQVGNHSHQFDSFLIKSPAEH